MKIFIDSANLEEIKKYMDWGVCDGVTTNPSICKKEGVKDIEQRMKEIAQLIYPRPLSVEVTSENPEEILTQARDLSKIAENIAVKVTITDRQGNSLLPVIHQLAKEEVRVNVTAIMTFNQAILASKAIYSAFPPHFFKEDDKPAHFISIFGGRISEEYGVTQAYNTIHNVKKWLEDWFYDEDIEIIVGSVRSPENVELWAKTGADVLTIPPDIIEKCLLSARTKETVAQFIDDATKA